MTSFRFSEDEFERLESKLETLRSENQICKRKLDSKCQALLILSKELDQCRSERDQFKLMAEQLRERYQAFKKQLLGDGVMLQSSGNPNPVSGRNQDLGAILYETREQNKSLQFEVEDLKQKLHDAQGDIKLLREQIARHRVGTSDEGMNIRHFPAHEREDLVQQLESSRNQYCQLERDLQQVLDEKEELVTERDVYKTKYARLNQELNYILKGDEKRVVDIDALVMENKYLQERLKQMEEEKSMAMATVSKYKNLLERKKTKSSLKLGQSRSGSLVITQKQVLQVLEEKAGMTPPSTQAMADLQSLAGALLETVNDKNLALSHQRKTNKILGNRISELEKKIKTLEVSGLWNIPSNASNLQKLKEECEEVKTLIPQSSEEDPVLDIDKSDSYHDNLPHSGVYSSNSSSINSSPVHSSSVSSPVHSQNSPSHRSYNSGAHQQSEDEQETLLSPDYKALVMDDLDLLPTKENIVKCVDNDDDGLALQNYKISTALGEAVLDPKFQQGLPYCMNEIESETEDTTSTEEHLKSLLEDMTAKMVNSQRSRSKKQYDLKSVNEDNQSESDIFIQSDHRDKDSRSSTPTCDKPLLSESAADKQGNLSEDTRNIEC